MVRLVGNALARVRKLTVEIKKHYSLYIKQTQVFEHRYDVIQKIITLRREKVMHAASHASLLEARKHRKPPICTLLLWTEKHAETTRSLK